jgi:hypothetical protein
MTDTQQNQKIQEQLETILREKFRRHLCSIWYSNTQDGAKYGIGTGNLIGHDNLLYVLTCHHVVEHFFKLPHSEINMAENLTITKKQVSFVASDEDEEIALIKLEYGFDETLLMPLTTNDFENVQDFTNYPVDESVFFVAGFPFDLTKKRKNITSIIPLFFQTVEYHGKQTEPTRLYLDYDKVESPSLPTAPGLSGAGIWYVPPIVSNEGSLWSPEMVKLISIQYAWMKNEYIVGSRVTKLFEWLS